jgi:hypothetical protein
MKPSATGTFLVSSSLSYMDPSYSISSGVGASSSSGTCVIDGVGGRGDEFVEPAGFGVF